MNDSCKQLLEYFETSQTELLFFRLHRFASKDEKEEERVTVIAVKLIFGLNKCLAVIGAGVSDRRATTTCSISEFDAVEFRWHTAVE